MKDAILKRCPVRALATLDKNLMLGDARNRELISLFLRARDWNIPSSNCTGTGTGAGTGNGTGTGTGTGTAHTREEAASAADDIDYLKLFKRALK